MDDSVQYIRSILADLESAASAEKRVAALQSIQETALGNGGVAWDLSHMYDDIGATLGPYTRSSNQFVSSKALSVISALLQRLYSDISGELQAGTIHIQHLQHNVKHLTDNLLSSIIEKLGDHRERIRDVAKACLVTLTKAAFVVSEHQLHGHHPETVFAFFERLLQEEGLHAKAPKVRENTLLSLPALRDAVDNFPLRPLMTSLVNNLSDADPHVREASRVVITSLFAESSPLAKSELKKEMEKQGVRKQTVDTIVEQVFASKVYNNKEVLSSQENISAPSAPRSKSSTPSTSLMPNEQRHKAGNIDNNDIKPVYVASRSDLEKIFANMLPHFTGKETEHNWTSREQDILCLRGMLKTSTYESFPEAFLTNIRMIQEGILKAVASLRTTLSIHALSLITELALLLGDEMDNISEAFLSTLIRMAGFTKKMVATSSQHAVSTILIHTTFRHKYLDMILSAVQDKNVSIRNAMCQHLVTILSVHGRHRQHVLEAHNGLEHLSVFCKKTLSDQNKDVRELARQAFYYVETIWPVTGRSIVQTLDPNTRKQVESNRDAFKTAHNDSPTPSKPKVDTNVTTPRRPGGPSHAILAAKRAAAASLAQERKVNQDETVMRESQDSFKDASPVKASSSLQQSPLPAKSPLRQRSLSPSHPTPSSPPLPTLIPLPASPTAHRMPSTQASPEARSRATSISSSSSNRSISVRQSSSSQPMGTYGGISQRFDSVQASSTATREHCFPEVVDEVVPLMDDSIISQPDERSANQGSDYDRKQSHKANFSGEGNESQTKPPKGTTSPSFSSSSYPASPTRSVTSVNDGEYTKGSSPRRTSLLPQPLPKSDSPTSGSLSSHLHNASRPSDQNLFLQQSPLDEVETKSEKQAIPHSSHQSAHSSRDHAPPGSSSAVKWFYGKASRLEDKHYLKNSSMPLTERRPESDECITQVMNKSATVRTFKMLVSLSKEFKLPQKHSDYQGMDESPNDLREQQDYVTASVIWQEGNLFGRLLDAVIAFLHEDPPTTASHTGSGSSSRDLQTAALVLLHRILEFQFGLVTDLDRERDVVDVLLDLAGRNSSGGVAATSIKSGCQAAIERWAENTDCIIGIATLRSTLAPSLGSDPFHGGQNVPQSSLSSPSTVAKWSLALHALAHLFGRLPAEVVEDQLEVCKTIVKGGLSHWHIGTRQKAVAVLVSANSKLHDPHSLFGILEPIDKAQQDLLIYYMNKT